MKFLYAVTVCVVASLCPPLGLFLVWLGEKLLHEPWF